MTGNRKRQESGAKARRARKFWVIVPILAVAGTAFVLSGWMRTPARNDLGKAGATFTARKDELIVTVVETGNIKAQQSTDIMCDLGAEASRLPALFPRAR